MLRTGSRMLGCLMGGIAALGAAEGDAAGDDGVAAAGDGAAAEGASPWTAGLELGAFLSNVATANAEDSRDPTIAGTTESISYEVNATGELDWERGHHAVVQDLILKYGRLKEEDEAWTEKIDLIDYDGAYKYQWREPHFVYGAWGGDSVFTGVEPDEEPLDPFRAKASTGYGQRYREAEPVKWAFEWRAGVRAQKTWGRHLTDREREVEIGPEAFARYEAKHSDDLSYWVQYEAFSEFDDLGHVINLLTAGFNYRFTQALSLKLGLRAYYESEPDDLEDGESDAGFDEVSLVQDTLLGVSYSF